MPDIPMKIPKSPYKMLKLNALSSKELRKVSHHVIKPRLGLPSPPLSRGIWLLLLRIVFVFRICCTNYICSEILSHVVCSSQLIHYHSKTVCYFDSVGPEICSVIKNCAISVHL